MSSIRETELFLLRDVFPDFARELHALLVAKGESLLAEQVDSLQIVVAAAMISAPCCTRLHRQHKHHGVLVIEMSLCFLNRAISFLTWSTIESLLWKSSSATRSATSCGL